MKIKDLPKVDMPRERLLKYGPKKLADHELLAILLGSGIKGLNVLSLARKVLAVVQKHGIGKVSYEDLVSIKGLGKAKALQIMALLELSARLHAEEHPQILSPQEVWISCADFRSSKKEHFAVFYFDTRERLIERQIMSIGTLDASLVHPRNVFEPALALHAASIIAAHNHPSGDLSHSAEDRAVTERLREAGRLLGIELKDHVVVSATGYRSVNSG